MVMATLSDSLQIITINSEKTVKNKNKNKSKNRGL